MSVSWLDYYHAAIDKSIHNLKGLAGSRPPSRAGRPTTICLAADSCRHDLAHRGCKDLVQHGYVGTLVNTPHTRDGKHSSAFTTGTKLLLWPFGPKPLAVEGSLRAGTRDAFHDGCHGMDPMAPHRPEGGPPWWERLPLGSYDDPLPSTPRQYPDAPLRTARWPPNSIPRGPIGYFISPVAL